MCNGCKHYFEDMNTNATDCDKSDHLTEEQFEEYFGNDKDGCPFYEEQEVVL